MTKTANEEIFDAVLRHQIYLLRYSGSVRNQVTKIINESEKLVAERIRERALSGGVRTTTELSRLLNLQASIRAIRLKGWQEAKKFLEKEMVDLAMNEAVVVNSLYQTTSPVVVQTLLPSEEFLRIIALEQPFEGATLADWADSMALADIKRLNSAVQAGMVAGDSVQAITRRAIGTKAFRGSDGATELTRKQVQAVVRTAVQHVANAARANFFEINSSVISTEKYVATLDSRTTPVCRANDGKTFPVGRGPQPPLHFNCRSVRIAFFNGVLLGNRPAKPSTEKQLLREFTQAQGLDGVSKRADLPRGSKAAFDAFSRTRVRALTGQVPADETYQTWLKKQPVVFQEDVLGKTKAALYRKGDLNLDKFVDYNGRELTLKELASKHAAAFRAAGLDPAEFL